MGKLAIFMFFIGALDINPFKYSSKGEQKIKDEITNLRNQSVLFI